MTPLVRSAGAGAGSLEGRDGAAAPLLEVPRRRRGEAAPASGGAAQPRGRLGPRRRDAALRGLLAPRAAGRRRA